MTESDRFEIRENIPTDLKLVNPFIDRVFQGLSERVKAEEPLFRVKLALEEALTNAMRHGNGMKLARHVAVCIVLESSQIQLDVHDEGNGFNPKTVPDPTQAGYAESMPGGRGIFLMKQVMDSVEFYDNGRGVRMIKKIL